MDCHDQRPQRTRSPGAGTRGRDLLLASLGFGGYRVHGNNSDEGQSYAAVRDFTIGDCLRDYRLVVEKADCFSAEAHYIAYDRVEGGTWCPEQRQNSGLREEGDLFVGTIELCVKRNTHVGECVYAPRFPDSGRMDSGFLLEGPVMCDPGYLEVVKAIPLEGGASDPSLVCGGVGPITPSMRGPCTA
ncbi:hypothetical protein ACIODW_18620 [Streptomyces sp. NPDC087897]|uniref:hypothetical protein n=1 Tax=Streptomyces sp. NPDC087897 TaxID=3365817 RepID=UPI0037F88D2B